MHDTTMDDDEVMLRQLTQQYGNMDQELQRLGLTSDPDVVAQELAVLEHAEAAEHERTGTTAVATVAAAPAASETAAAAAFMARLGAQFGDIDMTQLGLGLEGGENVGIITDGGNPRILEEGGSEESSLAEPTEAELEAWQAAQYAKGKQQQAVKQAALPPASVQARRRQLRNQRQQQVLPPHAAFYRTTHGDTNGTSTAAAASSASASASSMKETILQGEDSLFFTSDEILHNLISDEHHSDPDILHTAWKKLYASNTDGLGFWNYWYTLRGYEGPTLLILRCRPSKSKQLVDHRAGTNTKQAPPSVATTKTIGLYTTTPWQESTEFYGGRTGGTTSDTTGKEEEAEKAFLFAIHNQNAVEFFPVLQTKNCGGYMYCHLSTMRTRQTRTTATTTTAVEGMGFGSTPTQPRLHLTESLEDCRCLPYDASRRTTDGDVFATPAPGTTTTTRPATRDPINEHPFAHALYYFDVVEMEVWGVGGMEWITHALHQRERARTQYRQQYQTIDKTLLWNDDHGPTFLK